MTKTKTIVSPYQPFQLQQDFHTQATRFSVVVAHRRFGKTVMCVNHIIQKLLANDKARPVYAYIAPTKEQARRIVWDYVKQYTRFIPGVTFNESALRVDFPSKTVNGKEVAGAQVYVLGAEDPDTLRGMYLDGVVLDEVAQMPKSVWAEILIPALSDRQGWAVFIGTPKGKNYFYELYEQARTGKTADGGTLANWKAFMFKASETGHLDQEALDMAQSNMTPELYAQEYECSFESAIQGTYYGKTLEMLKDEGYVGSYPYNPNFNVITAWDIGLNDATAIWFVQQIGGEVHIIDFLEESDRGLNYFVNVLNNKPYTYDYHILPHDVMVRNFSTGVTRYGELVRAGLRVTVAPKLPVFDGINSVRSMLPLCRFNEVKCKAGLNSLFHYRSQMNERLGVAAQVPLHDKHSHAADAFRYLAIALRPGHKTPREVQFENEPTQENYYFDHNLFD